MNNQINIIDNQNQTVKVDNICYFLNGSNNKKYLFYTKNELVQDGLIKMYVAEENSGISNEITQDEWSALKLIMQNIIRGSELADLKFLSIQDGIKLCPEKVIALNQANIDAIKTKYNNDSNVLAAKESVSNKDLLSQSFGGTQTVEAVPQVDVPVNNIVQEPQVSTMQAINSPLQDLESTSVNMSTIPSVDNNLFMNTSPVQDVVPEVKIENNDAVPTFEVPQTSDISNLSMESVNEIAKNDTPISPIVSDFNVSNAPNIFDLPTQSVQGQNMPTVDLNPTIPVVEDNPMVVESEQIIDNNLMPEQNIFSGPQVPSVNELKETVDKETASLVSENIIKNSETSSSLNDDILEARIAIEKSNYNLYMNLAENSKKMAELLEKQIKKNEIDNSNTNLENTASDLFNSNGALDVNKVLGLNRSA